MLNQKIAIYDIQEIFAQSSSGPFTRAPKVTPYNIKMIEITGNNQPVVFLIINKSFRFADRFIYIVVNLPAREWWPVYAANRYRVSSNGDVAPDLVQILGESISTSEDPK